MYSDQFRENTGVVGVHAVNGPIGYTKHLINICDSYNLTNFKKLIDLVKLPYYDVTPYLQ